MTGLLAFLLPLGTTDSPPAVEGHPAAGLYAAPVPGEPTARFSGFLSSWEREPGSLPRPLIVDRPISLTVRLPRRPGEAGSAAFGSDLGGLGVGVTVYAVCPPGSPATPDGSCARLYFQVQTVLSGAAEAFCGASLSPGDALPFPVLQCAAPKKGTRLLGVTLHREPLRP